MKHDGVNVAFELIIGELEAVVEELNKEVRRAAESRKYAEVKKLGSTGEDLSKFADKVKLLQNEWTDKFDLSTREKTIQDELTRDLVKRSIAAHKKGKASRLRVTFLDTGKTIERHLAFETLIEAISEMGVEKVAKLGIKSRRYPLVSRTKLNSSYAQHPLGEYLVITNNSTDRKEFFLKEMAKKLGRRIKVEQIG